MLVAHQPTYFPYSVLLNRIDVADVFVIQDDLQFNRADYQHRMRVHGTAGPRWLTIPVSARSTTRINEVTIADAKSVVQHQRTFEQLYRHAPFTRRAGEIWAAAPSNPRRLVDVTISVLRAALDYLKIGTPVVLQSELGLAPSEQLSPSARLVALCHRLDCDSYLAGPGATNYADLALFERERIDVVWDVFRLLPHQQFSEAWIPGLSSADLLAWVENPLAHLRASRGAS